MHRLRLPFGPRTIVELCIYRGSQDVTGKWHERHAGDRERMLSAYDFQRKLVGPRLGPVIASRGPGC